MVLYRAALQLAEDLVRLRFDLLFLAAADERDHVREDVPRRHAGIAGAGDGLQRRDHRRLEAELAQRRERHRVDDDDAVRVRDDASLPAARALALQEREMIGVHFGDEQRDVGFHAVVARVADDDVAGLREGAFDFAGHRGVEAGEDELRRTAGRRGVDAERRDLVGQRRRQPPCRRVAIRLPRRSLARAEPRRPEPGMSREERDELLADLSGRSEDSDFDRHLVPLKSKKPTRWIHRSAPESLALISIQRARTQTPTQLVRLARLGPRRFRVSKAACMKQAV